MYPHIQTALTSARFEWRPTISEHGSLKQRGYKHQNILQVLKRHNIPEQSSVTKPEPETLLCYHLHSRVKHGETTGSNIPPGHYSRWFLIAERIIWCRLPFFIHVDFLACSSHQDSVLRRCCCTWVHHKDYKYPLFYWCVQSGPCFILMQFFISIMHAGCLFSCSKLNNVWFNIRSGFCEMLKPGFVNVFL